jgi:hypothetical protein
MKSIWQWCRKYRHDKLTEQHRMLCKKLRGHYQYYGVRNNYEALSVMWWRTAVLAEPEESKEPHQVGEIRAAHEGVPASRT